MKAMQNNLEEINVKNNQQEVLKAMQQQNL
jgi:hypothetical protein